MLLGSSGASLGQPVITAQPHNQTNAYGTTASFTVEATGTGPLVYQWQADIGSGFADRPDGTNATLVLTNVQSGEIGWYRAMLTDSVGTTTSDAARLQAGAIPVIPAYAQPTNWPVIIAGGNLTNRLLAGGTPRLNYQWYLNGSAIPGQATNIIRLRNLQLADAGDYTAVVANAYGSVTSRVATLVINPMLTKITAGPVVEDTDQSIIGVPADCDNDGRVELFVVNRGNVNPDRLYRHIGGDEFVRVTNELTSVSTLDSWAAAWGDIDNDGDLDMVIPCFLGSALPYPQNKGQIEMFRNGGGGVFSPMTNLATSIKAFWNDATWVDHDRDGLLDLFATTGNKFSAGLPSDYFFHNLGDGGFGTWSTKEVGAVLQPIYRDTAGPAWCDIDGDGDLDLYVSSPYAATNFLWRNDNGKLTRATAGSLPAANPTYAAAWADINNDGRFDLFTAGENGTNMLHLNRGNWVFEDVTVASGLALAGTVFTLSTGDFDNDGDVDLYIPRYDKPDVLYLNRGDGTFDPGILLLEGSGSCSAAWFDYNEDGFLDLFIPCGDLEEAPNLLYRNSLPQYGNTNHWLKVKLIGLASNRSAIGARVTASATIGGEPVEQVRQFLVLQDSTVHFGLGDATNALKLRIEWPSGIVQELQDVGANKTLTIVEHQVGATTAPNLRASRSADGKLQLSVSGESNLLYVIETSTDLVQWSKMAVVTNVTGIAEFTPPASTTASRWYRVYMP